MPSTMLNIIDLIKDYRRVIMIIKMIIISTRKKMVLISYVLNDIQACGEE